jgi:HSP20 family protein
MRNESYDLVRLFDSFFTDFFPPAIVENPFRKAWFPTFPPSTIKIDKKSKDLIYELAVAGYPKENINVDFDGDYMAIELKKVEEKESADCECLCCCVTRGRHEAKYYAPASRYDQSKAEASLKDGILKVRIPAKERQDTIKIAIQS